MVSSPTLQSTQHNNPEPHAPLQQPREEEEEASTYLPGSCTEPSLSCHPSGLHMGLIRLNLGDATVGLVSARNVQARGPNLSQGPRFASTHTSFNPINCCIIDVRLKWFEYFINILHLHIKTPVAPKGREC